MKNERDFLNFLKGLVVMFEGEETCKKLDELASFATEISSCIEHQTVICLDTVKEFNRVIGELYPERKE